MRRTALVVSMGVLAACDPVVFNAGTLGETPCPSNGLVLRGAVTLDCGGLTIKGKGVGTGISALVGEGATITNCVVDSFSIGVSVGGHGSHTLQALRVLNNRSNGVVIVGDFNAVTGVVSEKNLGVGFQLRGDSNFIGPTDVARENARGGFALSGYGQFLGTNYAVNNGGAGFSGTGRGSSFFSTTAVNNRGRARSFATAGAIDRRRPVV